jgi:hypothetical protein
MRPWKLPYRVLTRPAGSPATQSCPAAGVNNTFNQGTFGFGKFFHKITIPVGNDYTYVREQQSNLLKMTGFQREGLDAVVKMDKKVVYFHGILFAFSFLNLNVSLSFKLINYF